MHVREVPALKTRIGPNPAQDRNVFEHTIDEYAILHRDEIKPTAFKRHLLEPNRRELAFPKNRSAVRLAAHGTVLSRPFRVQQPNQSQQAIAKESAHGVTSAFSRPARFRREDRLNRLETSRGVNRLRRILDGWSGFMQPPAATANAMKTVIVIVSALC
jgi:hypothetical protein